MAVRLLLTGFGPFGSVVDNPTERIVRRLSGASFSSVHVEGLALPTSFARAKALVSSRLARGDVDALLMLGVAEIAEEFRVETVGRNLDDARLPDVDGAQPRGAIVHGAPDLLPVTLDAERLLGAISAIAPARLSDSAGAYVCNHLLYTSLHALHGSHVRAGFVHVPADPATHDVPRAPHRPFADHVAVVKAAIASFD